MKIYVIEKLESYEDHEWTVDNRCYTSRESAEEAAREMSVVAYVHSLDLVDELQEYAEQRRGDTADNVNHPAHYTNGEIECIDAIKAALSKEQYTGYLRGNVLKYLWRFDRKGGAEDLRKARTYLEWLIEAVDA